ncbi:fused MFS/spermidine synthase [Opitutus sp. ER46]|uniref:fused MFS/spermidine synthase n=1 Tax=Opitutus sp. ER46 TaxID=2161864 RepID=UPI000D31C18E|nr:fused MFS/spermidine synthase [Opitutus sp. ER46]PTX97903.1 ferrichrome ABC transporter permease [Opitutus sp. ER46]
MLSYALAIFTGAFLLFQVQPLIGKYILPWFGGGPGVWTTCLLFFQVVLLGGYAYAHFLTTHVRPRRQAIVHGVLLVAAMLLLPIAPGDHWKLHVAGNPTWQILLLLAGTIGLPYFVLSATGPLMQQWFSASHPGVSPYRLYALSNVGSLLALLSYPVFFEVKFSRFTQAALWSSGFVVFVALCGYCAWRLARQPVPGPSTPAADPAAPANPVDEAEARPAPLDKALWVLLPATASVLLLATTNKLCQEVAVIPFLWVLPLALYLLSFVICFDHARWYARGVFAALLAVGIAACFQVMPAGNNAPLPLQIAVYSGTLFVACMFCHGELYQLKPSPRYLTSFYLAISLGGALGGVLVALVAPALFDDYHDLSLGLWVLSYLAGVICFRQASRSLGLGAAVGAIIAVLLIPVLQSRFSGGLSIWEEWLLVCDRYLWFMVGGLAFFLGCVIDARTRRVSTEWTPKLGGYLMGLSVLVGIVTIVQWNVARGAAAIATSRNFYGTLKVYDYSPETQGERYRLLLHGATTHGLQFTDPAKALFATSYYGETSGVGLAIKHLPTPPGQRRLGLVGLGTGTLARYGAAGDYVRIYEINPAVERLARTHFTYLERSPAKVDVVMGDARLSMEYELAAHEPQKFDLLALDAFSSDAIPIHLLTREAFAIYLQQLKPDGIIAVHISNRYLDLRPVVERLAGEFDLTAVTISEDDEPNWWVYRTTWMLVSRNRALLETPEIREVSEGLERPAIYQPLWTDDRASLYQVLKR